MLYYLSTGSNIEPEASSVRMLCHLCESFGVLGVYPFRYTSPVSISSDNDFLNGLVALYFQGSSKELKAKLDAIEEAMGRDRSDPDRSIKGRRADLDILGASDTLSPSIFGQTDESYVQQVFELRGRSPDLEPFGLAAYQRPASVYLDGLTGEIVVVEDEFKRFDDWVKAALEIE
jgi:2-amino-4-hydroxy-6-hydroxymethyldihydropteridine diphosphokinase